MKEPRMIAEMDGKGFGGFSGRHPLFMAAAVSVSAVLAADRGLAWGLVVAMLWGVAGWFFAGRMKAVAWLLCGALAAGVLCVKKDFREETERELVGSGGRISARLVGDARGGGGFWEGAVSLRGGKWDGAKVWWEGRGEPPADGSLVEGVGTFVEVRGPRNAGEFDEAAWLRRKGVIAIFQGRTLAVETGDFAKWGASIRQGFRTAVTAGLEEDSDQAKVIRATVIGEAPADADELVAAFRNSGTLHIFSVSGMHVAMVGGICWIVLRLLRVRRKHAIPILLALTFGYAWITGNSPPALRSAWMMAVFLMGFVFRREPDLLNSLGAVLLVAMLWDGNLLFQPGVQLSYGVVAAIGAGTAAASRMFAWMGKREEYLPEGMETGWRRWWLAVRRKSAIALGVSAAAWVGSTPLTIWHFGLVTPVAFFATFVLGPMVNAMLGLALLSAMLHPISQEAAGVVNRCNGWIADRCVGAAEFLSGIPGSHFSTRLPGEPELIVFDLPYGDGAACFSGGNEGAVLLDCGGRRSFRTKVMRSLREQGISPDSVVISHPDGGHLGGGSDVWRAFPIRQVLLPVERARSAAYKEWRDGARAEGIKVRLVPGLRDVPMPDGARLEILHAPDAGGVNRQADERVAVFRLHWRGWKILLMSDAGITTETRMLASGEDLSADVVVAGKNAFGPSPGGEFLDAVDPEVIVASHADFPPEERLAPGLADYWRSRGIRVIDQGASGGVTIRIEESGSLILEGFVDGSEIRLPPK